MIEFQWLTIDYAGNEEMLTIKAKQKGDGFTIEALDFDEVDCFDILPAFEQNRIKEAVYEKSAGE